MVLSRKVDYRKRKKREVFFSPSIPLIIVLLLLLLLVILVQTNQSNFSASSGYASNVPAMQTNETLTKETKAANNFSLPFWTYAVSGLGLTKTSYKAGESLKGNFTLRFYPTDLIPADTNITFNISSVKCNNYYVCSDGMLAPWEVYNATYGKCRNVTTWEVGPWWDNCGESYNVYPNINSNVNCTGLGGKCCDPGKGIGNYYPNLNCSAKECWDDCATTGSSIRVTLKNLVDSYSLNKGLGNYTYGRANNVNGSEPPDLYGYGFGYCYLSAPSAKETPFTTFSLYSPNFDSSTGITTGTGTGYVISQPSYADLVVESIYIRETGGTQPPGGSTYAGAPPGGAIRKVYANIRNIGQDVPIGSFVVLACWYTLPVMPQPMPSCNKLTGQIIPPVPSNCRNVTVTSLPAGGYEFEIGNLDFLRDHAVYVYVDYCERVAETNENNNVRAAYLGCYDPDGQNQFTKETCVDLYGEHTDYCETGGGTPSAILYEYVCEPQGGYIGMVCYPKQINCGDAGCYDGACGVSPTCNDSDGGLNYYVKGICTDMLPYVREDGCNGNVLTEWQCVTSATGDYCAFHTYDCSKEGKVCENGACVVPQPKLPDLIVVDVTRQKFGSEQEGTRITMKNIGNGNVSVKSFFVNVSYLNLDWSSEIQVQSQGITPGTTFILDVTAKDISGQAVNSAVIIDSQNNVAESNEKNNYFVKWLSPYTCESWNNVYTAYLDSLGLKAPSVEGHYNLSVSLVHGNTMMYNSSVQFIVTKTYTKKVCQNRKCVSISCNPPNCNSNCTSDEDCRGVCNENWQYASIGGCVDGKQLIECYDAANCGTTNALPMGCTYDSRLGKYVKIVECCVENWQCDEWSVCFEKDGSMIQTKTCQDLNKCNPQNYTYIQLRDCCIEEWDCKWSACENGIQTLECRDLNNCGTEFTKPKTETRSCVAKVGLGTLMWIIIIVVIIAIITILFATKVIGPKRSKAKEKAEAGVGAGAGAISAGAVQPQAQEYPELSDYIKKAMAAGVPKDEIKKKLVEAGWPEVVVNKELSKI